MIGRSYAAKLTLIIMITTLIPIVLLGFFVYGTIDYSSSSAYKILSVFFVLAALLLIWIGFVGYSVSKHISKPMEILRNAAREISAGKYDIYIEHKPYKDEVGEVMIAFNQMGAKLHENYQMLMEQALQLMENNSQLQDMNIELEASYEQLQATAEQLNHSEEKYRLLIENISELVWVMDPNGNISYINDQVELILGYKKELLIGKPLSDILCPLHEYAVCANIIEGIKQNDYENFELWMLAADGQRRVVMETNTKRIYQNGLWVGVQGLGRDVTEKRKLEKEIRRTSKEIASLYEISSVLTASKTTLKIDELLDQIVDKVIETLGVSLCSIRLLENQKQLILKACKGPLSSFVYRDAIYIDGDRMGKAVKEKRTVVFNDLGEDHVTLYNQGVMEKNRIKHVAFIPLIVEEEVIGVMTVSSEDRLDQGNIHILDTLSNHAAVAIEKARLYEDLKESYFKTIRALAVAVEAKDTYTQGHSLRVAQYAVEVAKHLGMNDQELEEIEVAGILHDIGKIGISDLILTKPGKLDEEEYSKITQHPIIGRKILEPIGLSPKIMEAILLHHRRHDLKGYPQDIEVKQLPLYAEIIGVVDAFDAMTSQRSYRRSLTMEEALEELKNCSGSQFHPEVVEAMVEIHKSIS
ncbi:PAS domain S-box-containing protein/HDIG domain-containing protein [Geosporobacter subterraneus DSM 17957]|uniref:PAS domain S-box-containing protein/HDIG domain-containing protein n=1 Tax=Geosporobacter subterraneus DSM 17957 TaxID=1121919 RepID=A0A1M6KM82_9FIRM|nr:HD domain-containing phosphohydrolase [Geosporobacter subterraneus]SHJ60093.1 PAS domain S-box-containing protein/HDIG domain-containing protein [Geosporobacter subterraneus DSM 17957]